jgi:Kef-type K+ transport system membrane component KefB
VTRRKAGFVFSGMYLTVPAHGTVQEGPMTGVWALAALWLGLALIASLLAIWFRISSALSEIVVGTIAQLIIGAVIGSAILGTDESWVKFLSGIGAIVLTFLAGAELDPTAGRLGQSPSYWM